MSDCPGCDGRCCRSYRVPINGSDMQRLAQGLLMPAEAFSGLLPADDGDRGKLRLADSDQRWSLHLHRFQDGRCTLLLPPLLDGTERCGVYEHRPGACRAYPATMRGGVTVRDDAVCPPGWCGFLDTPSEVWFELLEQTEKEWDLYETVLERWDDRVGSDPIAPATFLAWLTEAYAGMQ